MPARSAMAAAAAVFGASAAGVAFVMPQQLQSSSAAATVGAAQALPGSSASPSSSASWSLPSMAGLAVGVHVGLALASSRSRGRTSRQAAEKAASASYVESAQDKKLFEDVFKAYTMEYLKGPMYVDERKDMKAFEPGMPIWDENKKLTSNILGPWKRVSSNELAFVTMVSLVIGLWGYLQFNYFDPQFPKVDAGEPFNPVYIIAFLGLPLSFVSHLACYIQKTNGK
mmetsp:Transcript_14688/g.34640  ORF Transcript_14688/g.34640 Transcript_14688/m.34640 type:complete len:227 (+) Transcript_14688:92-772(+)